MGIQETNKKEQITPLAEGDGYTAKESKIDIYSKKGTKVKFTNASDNQVRWGSNDDPRQYLEMNEIYTIDRTEVHTQHTKVYLQEYPDKKFNSVHFEAV